eukprot:ANDGO_07474.mRNA.1 hypothetical protein
MNLSPEELQSVYTWVDEIPLSRPKRNISRDFADGVLMAEVVHHFFPKIVELHNYSAANGVTQKSYNWNTLNQKVLRRLGFVISKADIEDTVNCVPGTVERILRQFMLRLGKMKARAADDSSMDASFENDDSLQHLHKSQPQQSQHQSQQPQHHHHQVLGTNNSSSSSGNSNANSGGIGSPKKKSSGSNAAGSAVAANQDESVRELRETIEILEMKVRKLEQLVKLKDQKIAALTTRLDVSSKP